jgi:ketosteroid isomerase-like protein
MHKRFLAVLICVLVLSLPGFAQHKHTVAKKTAVAAAPDKAYMQQIWDGWATLDPSHVAQYYAIGPHTFFDLAPLKYNSWEEYQEGVKKILAGYKSATLTVNDDAEVHREGNNWAWGTATIKEDMTTKAGKHEMGTFRWTVVWQKQDGKWLIVHEHVSEPLQM